MRLAVEFGLVWRCRGITWLGYVEDVLDRHGDIGEGQARRRSDGGIDRGVFSQYVVRFCHEQTRSDDQMKGATVATPALTKASNRPRGDSAVS